jgi:hypothetical protein
MFTTLSTPRDAHEGFTIYVLRLSRWWRQQSLRGFIAGIIAGGLGSRIAMRVMALTSAHSVRGSQRPALRILPACHFWQVDH